MAKLLMILMAVLLGFVLAAVWAVSQFGWIGLLGVVAVIGLMAVAAPKLAGAAGRRFVMNLMATKSEVLKRAGIKLHAVHRATAPEGADEEPRDWYWLDVTIRPTHEGGKMKYWEPGELMLVSPEAKPFEIENNATEWGYVHEVQIWQDGWQPDDPGKYEGKQRLRLLVGVRPQAPVLRFRYYFEIFGKLDLSVTGDRQPVA